MRCAAFSWQSSTLRARGGTPSPPSQPTNQATNQQGGQPHRRRGQNQKPSQSVAVLPRRHTLIEGSFFLRRIFIYLLFICRPSRLSVVCLVCVSILFVCVCIRRISIKTGKSQVRIFNSTMSDFFFSFLFSPSFLPDSAHTHTHSIECVGHVVCVCVRDRRTRKRRGDHPSAAGSIDGRSCWPPFWPSR